MDDLPELDATLDRDGLIARREALVDELDRLRSRIDTHRRWPRVGRDNPALVRALAARRDAVDRGLVRHAVGASRERLWVDLESATAALVAFARVWLALERGAVHAPALVEDLGGDPSASSEQRPSRRRRPRGDGRGGRGGGGGVPA